LPIKVINSSIERNDKSIPPSNNITRRQIIECENELDDKGKHLFFMNSTEFRIEIFRKNEVIGDHPSLID
jgi:hypothetical protein